MSLGGKGNAGRKFTISQAFLHRVVEMKLGMEFNSFSD